jgi:hypothetical protein
MIWQLVNDELERYKRKQQRRKAMKNLGQIEKTGMINDVLNIIRKCCTPLAEISDFSVAYFRAGIWNQNLWDTMQDSDPVDRTFRNIHSA